VLRQVFQGSVGLTDIVELDVSKKERNEVEEKKRKQKDPSLL